jgi:hypothetical protein
VELDAGAEVGNGARSSWRLEARRSGSGASNSLVGRGHTKLLPSPACWSIHRGGSPSRWCMHGARRCAMEAMQEGEWVQWRGKKEGRHGQPGT